MESWRMQGRKVRVRVSAEGELNSVRPRREDQRSTGLCYLEVMDDVDRSPLVE